MNQIDLRQLMQAANYAAQTARSVSARNDALTQELQSIRKGFDEMQGLLSRLQVQSRYGDPGIQRVENIPGRRIPFDMLVDIAIPTGSTAVRQGTITINQEGPFVAVARSFHLVSAFEAVRTDPDTQATTRFQGRSYGRYRTIHSAWDLNDGQPVYSTWQAEAFPGTGNGHIISPSNTSSFRSMGGDFRVKFSEAGSSFPRSNLEVPSPMWTKAINEPWDLGSLDVFERGEVLKFELLPLHVMNPPAGNVANFAAANPTWPFLSSQYDAVEGILDPVIDQAEEDPIERQANAVATIGFHGFLIQSSPGIPQGI